MLAMACDPPFSSSDLNQTCDDVTRVRREKRPHSAKLCGCGGTGVFGELFAQDTIFSDKKRPLVAGDGIAPAGLLDKIL